MEIQYKKSPRAKKLSIKIKHDRTVVVVMPRWVSQKKAQKFVEQQSQWIQKGLKKIPDSMKPLDEREIKDLRKRAKSHLPDRTHHFAALHDLSIGRVSIRNQSTRW